MILLGRLASMARARPPSRRDHSGHGPLDDPAIRKSPLTPYAREAELKTLDLLDDSLMAAANAVQPTIVTNLLSAAARDIEELLPHLERAARSMRKSDRKLAKRGEEESKPMREILESQRKHIATTVEKSSQAFLPFPR